MQIKNYTVRAVLYIYVVLDRNKKTERGKMNTWLRDNKTSQQFFKRRYYMTSAAKMSERYRDKERRNKERESKEE
jgi:hypothetical protein